MNDLEVALRIKAQTEGREKIDAMGASLASLGEGADANLKSLESELAQVTDEAGKTGAAASGVAKKIDGIGDAAHAAEQKSTPAHRKIRDGVDSISTQLADLQKAVVAYLGVSNFGSMIGDVAKTADEYKNLSARIRLVTGDGEAFSSAMSGVTRVALESNSSLSSTAELFTRIYAAGKEMKLGQEQALALTQTINSAIQVSGASAASAEAATTQLIQGLQSGVLRGEEFNSMMEQSPRLAKALADGLGVPLGKLRELANAGSLTSQTVITALQSQGRVIEEEYAKLPATIGRAMTNLKTQWTVFIGETDKGAGISEKAAHAIDLLARNLDTVATAAMSAGKAWLAWKAYNIAAEFLTLRAAVASTTAAKLADTAATAANTVATAANTAAQTANNAARAGAATGIGNVAGAVSKLGGVLSLVKGFSWAFLLTNLPEIGQWIGITTAKLMGYGKAQAEAESRLRSYEQAARAAAAMNAELAQKAKLAHDAALGLNSVSLKMIADFEEARKSGEGVADALGKVEKAMNLSDAKGITDAAAALDVLAQKGEITAQAVSDAWAKALDGKDLKIFEVEAIAAFDNSEQGAHRLAQAMDGAVAEALRRTGKDMSELTNGVGKAARSAINDFDMLATNLEKLREKGVNVGVALSASLNKALEAAKTEKAVQEVIDRFEALGKQGALTGDQLRDGLAKARGKLDELKPGINSVNEAFEGLGLKSKAQLDAIAAKAKENYDFIVKEGTSSTDQVAKAFEAYATKAIEANGGVATSAIKVEAAMRGVGIEVDKTTGKVTSLKTALNNVKSPSGGGSGGSGGKGSGGNSGDDDTGRQSSFIKNNNFSTSPNTNGFGNFDNSQSRTTGVYKELLVDQETEARKAGLRGDEVKYYMEVIQGYIDDEEEESLHFGIGTTDQYLDAMHGAFIRSRDKAVEYARKKATQAKNANAKTSGRSGYNMNSGLSENSGQSSSDSSGNSSSSSSASTSTVTHIYTVQLPTGGSVDVSSESDAQTLIAALQKAYSTSSRK